MKNRGFFLLDAAVLSAFSIAVIAGASSYRSHVQQIHAQDLYVNEVVEVMVAIDRRALLDGFWGDSWRANALDGYAFKSALDAMLISESNPECPPDEGWQPQSAHHAEMRLIPCELFEPHAAPVGMSGRSMVSAVSDNGRLEAVELRFYFNSDEQFERRTGFSTMVAKLREALPRPIAGEYQVGYTAMDRSGMISTKECSLIGRDCAISVRYQALAEPIVQTGDLRVAGGVLDGPLWFERSGDMVTCFRAGAEEPCGATQDMNLIVGEVTSQSLLIGGSLSSCFDVQTGHAKPCGLSSSEGLARLHANEVTAYRDLAIVGDQSLAFTTSGETHMSLNLEHEAGVVTGQGLDITVDGSTVLGSIEGDIWLDSTGRVNVGEVVGAPVHFGVAGLVDFSQPCEDGSMTVSEEDKLYTCVFGAWEAGGEGIPAGAVVPVGANACPSGWSVLDATRTNFRLEGLSRSVGSFSLRVNNESLTEHHLPRHSHNISTLALIDYASSASGGGGKAGQMRVEQLGSTGTGERAYFVPLSYAVEFCIKD